MNEKAETLTRLASEYSSAARAASLAAVDAEAEAQLTVPVSNLFSGLVAASELGKLDLIRETRLDSTRPDFAALHTRSGKTIQKGYVELKAPDVPVDVSRWKGRNARQWERMKDEADIVIVCNGSEAQLYHHGTPQGRPASLPLEDAESWNAAALVSLLDRFLELKPTPITRVTDLSARLAVRTADLRDRLLWLLDAKGGASDAAAEAYTAWRQHVYPHASARDFADGISQVISYGMVLAALSGRDADTDHDGHISVAEARVSLRLFSPVLAAAFAPLIDKPTLNDAVRVELGALETLVSAIDPIKVNATADRRGDRWLSFYEDFLEVYDPEERRQAGVYFTPIDIVAAMKGDLRALAH